MGDVINMPGCLPPPPRSNKPRCTGCRKTVDEVLADPMDLHVHGARCEVWMCLDCHVRAFKALVRNQREYVRDLERLLTPP